MNLKNKWLWKKLLKWVNKKQNNFNVYNIASFLKNKENTYRYHSQKLNDMIYSSWDIDQNLLKLVTLGYFLLFYLLKNQKNHNFEIWKNLLEISSFYICVPKITIIWCTFPEIRNETDIIFVIWGHILPFYHCPLLMIQKSKFWKKWKKCLEIISFYTYMFTINGDHRI